MLVPEELPPSVNSSASTTIQSAINLKYNQKKPLAAIIKTNKETVRVPMLEEKKAIDQLLQENEHIYLFSIELKKHNKAEMRFSAFPLYCLMRCTFKLINYSHPQLLFFSSLLQFLKTPKARDCYSFFCKLLTFLQQN